MATDKDAGKRHAAEAALAAVTDGMRLGLGTGSTARHFIELLAERVRQGLRVQAVPSSRASEQLASSLGIPLITFEQTAELDLTVDGADEIDPALRLIKGGGGAMLRERIVAAAARRVIIIADASKLVAQLGAFPLPVEVSRFGWPVAARGLAALGGKPALRRTAEHTPFVSDEGHFIVDCQFESYAEPEKLSARLHEVPAVLAHGLFFGLADEAIVSDGTKLTHLTRQRGAAR